MKPLLILTFTLFITACGTSDPSFQKGNEGPTITVDATGEIKAPADLIRFHIQLTRFSETAGEAFFEHKKLEEFLTRLLLEEGIAEDSIQTEPVSIQTRRRGEQHYGFETRQSVILRLEDIAKFEEMQLVLIENNFDNFSGSFSSSALSQAENDALSKAIEEARREAQILAEAAGGRVGSIRSIRHGGSVSPYPAARMEMSYDASGGSLLQFEQTIPVQKNVQVVFELLP